MARLLRQSTAKTLRYGPFLDDTDFKTEETGLAGAMVVEIQKNGAAFAARNSATAIAHDSNGWYSIELNATDTNTLGPLTVKVDAAGHLPVWEHFMVVPANVYDSIVAGSDTLQADVVELGGVAQSATDLKDFADAGYDPATDRLTDTRLANLDATVSSRSTLTAAQVNAEVDAALDTAIPGVPTAGSINERVKTMDDADIPAAVAGVQADTNDIQTRLPAALVGGRMDAIASVIGVNAVDAAALSADAVTEIVTGILAGIIEGAVTLKQSLQLSNAAAASKLSGAATTTATLRNLADTLDRIVATVDADGNRTAVSRTFE